MPYPISLDKVNRARLARVRNGGGEPDAISATEQLWELVGEPLERVVAKETPALDERTREFMAASPLLVMATPAPTARATPAPRAGRRVSSVV